jgi:hypothetical protein
VYAFHRDSTAFDGAVVWDFVEDLGAMGRDVEVTKGHSRDRHYFSPRRRLKMHGLARTKTALRCVSEYSRLCRLQPTIYSRRHIHIPKQLPYPIENGVGDFLPPAALKTLAVDYQEGLLHRLSEEVKGTPHPRVK